MAYINGKEILFTAKVTPTGEQEIKLQDGKTVTKNGIVVPDTGYDGFKKVTVNVPIPENYIKPSGTKNITENGTHDVTKYASVNVQIETGDVTAEIYNGEFVTTISFTVNDKTYQAADGMTFGDWIDSEYNVDGFYWSDDTDSIVIVSEEEAGGGDVERYYLYNGDYAYYDTEINSGSVWETECQYIPY